MGGKGRPMRRGPKPAKEKEAKPPVARKAPKNEGARVRDLEKRLAERLERGAEALERETAAREILRVISGSPTDVQPVLDAVAESAARLCGADDALIHRVEGDTMRLVAHFGSIPYSSESAIRPIVPRSHSGRSILERRVVHDPDMLDARSQQEFAEVQSLRQRSGARTVLATPLLREDVALGVIVIRRTEVRPFSDKHIELLQTFASQAVIAIENVRLFTELQEKNEAITQAHAQVSEALEQQTATAEILAVISQSPTDVQPVFDTIAESATRLCESSDAEVFRRDGDRLLLVAHHGPIPNPTFTVPVVRGTVNGRATLEGRTVHVADLPSETDEFPQGSDFARRGNTRAQLSIPMMRQGVAIGTISIRRTEAELFTERQVAVLQTFADQAVIAIENVRLFKELQEKNRALAEAHAQVTEALERQTATGEILRVISSSPTDVEPVFETIVHSAVRLCGALFGGVSTFDGEM